MDAYLIHGGNPLRGTVAASGAKNAALPIMAASILASEPVALANVPRVTDVDTMSLLLGHLGVEVAYTGGGQVRIETVDESPSWGDYEVVRRMRASLCVLGPLLARRGRAAIAMPGGCNLGNRPIDLHLRGLAALGADLQIEDGYIIGRARRLRGATIDLAGPRGPTVTGTANVLSAATLAQGRTRILNAACEPEIVDLGRFLIGLGARIEGLGTPTLEIDGVRELRGTNHRIVSDRVEAATLLLAAAITGGSVTVTGATAAHLTTVLQALAAMGCQVRVLDDSISLTAPARLRSVQIVARPYPGLPTDLQAPFAALLSLAEGRSDIRDIVFPDRVGHVHGLRQMGADLIHAGRTTTIHGVSQLTGAEVDAADLRAGAALVLAALAADGHSVVRNVEHLDRGYDSLDAKLRQLGAQIERESFAHEGMTAYTRTLAAYSLAS